VLARRVAGTPLAAAARQAATKGARVKKKSLSVKRMNLRRETLRYLENMKLKDAAGAYGYSMNRTCSTCPRLPCCP
jgi:hypothetical protein